MALNEDEGVNCLGLSRLSLQISNFLPPLIYAYHVHQHHPRPSKDRFHRSGDQEWCAAFRRVHLEVRPVSRSPNLHNSSLLPLPPPLTTSTPHYTLNSTHPSISPYFFNAGLLYSGSLLNATADAYAKILNNSRIPEFDVLFGPAYKGISLAAVTACALSRDYGRDQLYCYNRKEAKDHGEGGSMVGAPLKGRIVIIDDVLTSGKAVREAIGIIKAAPEAELVGIVQLVDRQERGQGESGKSSVQEVEADFGIPVEPIIGMSDIMAYLEQRGDSADKLESMRKYRETYGIKQA